MLTTILNLALPKTHPGRRIEINGYQAESYSEKMSEPKFDEQEIMGRSPIAIYGASGSRTVGFSMMFHRDMFAPSSVSVYGYHGMPVINNVDGAYRQLGASSNFDNEVNLMTDKIEAMRREEQALLERNLQLRNGFGRRDISNNGLSPSEQMLQTKERLEIMNNFSTFINQLKALNYPVYATNGVIPPSVYLKIGNSIRLKGWCTASVEWDGLVNLNQLISCTVTFNFTEIIDKSWSATEVYEGMQRYITWADKPLEVR